MKAMNMFWFLAIIVVGQLLLTWLSSLLHVPRLPFTAATIYDMAHIVFGMIIGIALMRMVWVAWEKNKPVKP